MKPNTFQHDGIELVRDEFPRFDLECYFDRVRNPKEMTILSTNKDEIDTHWVTIDIAHAVPLDHII